MYVKSLFYSLAFLLTISVTFISLPVSSKETLVFAIDVIRHGDRTATKVIPKHPHSFPEGLGQLTQEGMRQSFELGLKLRGRYIDEYALLPPRYQQETLHVRSTGFDRTLMTAQSFLLGLYPLGTGPSALPKGFQPIPIHSVALDTEELLLPKNEDSTFKALVKEHLLADPVWKAKMAELHIKLGRWSKLSGFDTKDPYQLIDLADILHVYKLHHIPVPSGFSKKDVKQIIEAGKFAHARAYRSKAVGKAAAGHFLQKVAGHLKTHTQDPKGLKYMLFSAHDTTLLTIMSALGVPLEEPPRYASHLNFALFKNGENHFVQVSLNDEIISIPGCNQEGCSLAQFGSLIQ